jgi:hypothetical protein
MLQKLNNDESVWMKFVEHLELLESKSTLFGEEGERKTINVF